MALARHGFDRELTAARVQSPSTFPGLAKRENSRKVFRAPLPLLLTMLETERSCLRPPRYARTGRRCLTRGVCLACGIAALVLGCTGSIVGGGDGQSSS